MRVKKYKFTSDISGNVTFSEKPIILQVAVSDLKEKRKKNRKNKGFNLE